MKRIFTIAVIAVSVFMIKDAFTSNNGIAGRTNAPGETTCTGCHNSFALNSGGGSILIACPTLINWQYTPGVTYPITVTVSKTGVNKYGFSLEALQASGANGGALTVTNATETWLKSVTVLGNSRQAITHKTVATSTGTHTFTFNWVAPATNIGNVTFYAAGNCANGLNNTSSDYIYTASQVVTPATAGIITNTQPLQQVTVFPNPVSDFVNVHFTNSKTQAVKIELYDLNAKFQELLYIGTENTGMELFRFNFTKKYSKGIYFLKVQAGNEVAFKKILITNN